MQNEAHPAIQAQYAFGPFRMDLRERRLLNAGAPVALPIKLFDLLAALVSAPGHLRSRDELVDAVWPQTIVEEHSLTSRISALRKVLGDEGEKPAYIETVRGVGYRFIADVRAVDEDGNAKVTADATRRHSRAAYLAAAAIALLALAFAILRPQRLAAPPRSIAVLPFANLGGDAKDDYFADGLQTMILTRLAGIRDMRVIARASTARLPTHPDDLRRIADELGVASVLEGSVQREDDQVLVNVQLVDVASGVNLWARAYSRRRNNVLDIENDIAAEIATALNGRLETNETAALQAAPTHDAAAYDAFLKAEHAALAVEEGGDTSAERYRAAADAYRDAIARDPDFALAHARLSFLMIFAAWFGVDPAPDLVERAEAEAREALRADIAQAHLAIGYVLYWGHRDYAGALDAFRLAERKLPNNPAAKGAIAFIERRRGNSREALAGLEQAELLDPRNSLWFAERGTTFAQLGRYADAVTEFGLALSIDPANVRNRVSDAVARAYSGDVAAADTLLAPISSESDTSGVAESAKVRMALWRREPDRALAAIDVPDEEWLEDIARSSLPAALLRARAWSAKGDMAKAATEYEAARGVLDQALRQHPENFSLWSALAEADAGLGRDAQAREAAARAMELMSTGRDAIAAAVIMTSIAETYGRLADAGKAVELLKRLESMSVGDLVSVASLRGERCWDPIRGDPAFEATIAEYASIEARRNESAARGP